MDRFKVTPFQNGAITTTAPAMIIEAMKADNALSEAKKLSGLARFESWKFKVVEMTTPKQISKFRKPYKKRKEGKNV